MYRPTGGDWACLLAVLPLFKTAFLVKWLLFLQLFTTIKSSQWGDYVFQSVFPVFLQPCSPRSPRFLAFMIIFNAKKAVLDLSAVFGQKWSRVLAWMLLVLFGRLTDRPLRSWFKQHPLLGARQNLCRLRGIWFLVGFRIGKWFSIWIWPWIREIFGSTNFHKPFAKNSWMNSIYFEDVKVNSWSISIISKLTSFKHFLSKTERFPSILGIWPLRQHCNSDF